MRDKRIDTLRGIGLAMIILAHVEPPAVIFQLRNFDVPLMVLVAGMSFALSYRRSQPYLSYVKKRLLRLVCPLWIFLALYFAILKVFVPQHPDLEWPTIVSSATLGEGIGYVWIIRVFVLVALVSPLLFALNERIRSSVTYLAILGAAWLLYEIYRLATLAHLAMPYMRAISPITHYIIPYAIVFALGLRISALSSRQVSLLALASLMCVVLSGTAIYWLEGSIRPTQTAKYPPSIYYLSYALMVSLLLVWRIEDLMQLTDRLHIAPCVEYMGQHSMWIYLWHIGCLKIIGDLNILYFIPLIFISVLITFLQNYIFDNVILVFVPEGRIRDTLISLFTG